MTRFITSDLGDSSLIKSKGKNSLMLNELEAGNGITLTDATGKVTIATNSANAIGSTIGAKCTAQIDATSGTTGTTLTNVTGMSVTLIAGATYHIEAYITGTSTANSGAKFALSGTATATSISYSGEAYNTTTNGARTVTTTLGNAVGAATAVYTLARISGVIVVNAGGTLTVQFAQNASHADTTSVYVGSVLTATRIA